jgi:purine-binding chemotaxis protein CheW
VSRRRPAPAKPAAPDPLLRLPPSGLAHEILGALEGAPAPAGSPGSPASHASHGSDGSDGSDAAEVAGPAAPAPAPGPARVYSFADSLERREAAASAPAERPESWVVFEVAGELYALPAARIQEIQRASGITRVPHAPAPVHGIVNLRGRVLVVVDLRQRLGAPPALAGERSRILVVFSRERSIGLLVDAAHQVVKLLASRIQPPPAGLGTNRSAFLSGVVEVDKNLVMVLDVEQLLLVPEELAIGGARR